MSKTPDVPEVRMARDDGEKRRWGAGTWIYRQDGRKSTLESKKIVACISAAFIISSLIVLVSSGSDAPPSRQPIIAAPDGSGGQMVQVPAFVGEIARNYFRGGSSGPSVPRFLGAKVIARPRFTKLPPGSFVRAVLETGASNGLVKAHLAEPLVISGETAIEDGTVLIGTGSSSEDRLTISFSKLVFSDGSTQTVQAQACDLEDKIVGLKGEVVNRALARLGVGVGLNFAGGLAEGLQESEVQNGVSVRKSNLRNAMLNGSAHAALDQGKEVMTSWRAQKTVVQVKQGTEFFILFGN